MSFIILILRGLIFILFIFYNYKDKLALSQIANVFNK